MNSVQTSGKVKNQLELKRITCKSKDLKWNQICGLLWAIAYKAVK
jgi:hypothetical protein